MGLCKPARHQLKYQKLCVVESFHEGCFSSYDIPVIHIPEYHQNVSWCVSSPIYWTDICSETNAMSIFDNAPRWSIVKPLCFTYSIRTTRWRRSWWSTFSFSFPLSRRRFDFSNRHRGLLLPEFPVEHHRTALQNLVPIKVCKFLTTVGGLPFATWNDYYLWLFVIYFNSRAILVYIKS